MIAGGSWVWCRTFLGERNFILQQILWWNIRIALTTPKREEKHKLKRWMTELDLEFFLYHHKRGNRDEGHLPSAAFVTCPRKDKNPYSRWQKRKKEVLFFFVPSFSLCLAGFCSPLWSYISCRRCMKFTLSEKSNTTALPPVTVCVCARFMECIIKLKCEAKLSSPPLLRLHVTLLIPTSLFYTYLFPHLYSCSLWPRLHACNLCW